MEETNQTTQSQKSQTWLIIVLILIIFAIVILAFWYFSKPKEVPIIQPSVPVPSQPTPTQTTKPVTEQKVIPEDDSVSTINDDLQKIEISDLESEFKEIDQDLNSL